MPTLPAPSLSFPDPFSTGGSGGAPPRPARQGQPAFFHDVVDVHFHGAKFNAQFARYFEVRKIALHQQSDLAFACCDLLSLAEGECSEVGMLR